MRLPAIVIAASLVAQGLIAASAHAEDRYGPTSRAVAAEAANLEAAPVFEAGRALRWSGKAAAPALAPSDIGALQPQPLAGGLLSRTSAGPRPALRQTQPVPAARPQAAPTQVAGLTPQLRGPLGPPAPPRALPDQPAPPRPAPAQPQAQAQPRAAQPQDEPRPQAKPQAQSQVQAQAQGHPALPTSLFDDGPDPAQQAAAAAAAPPRPVAVAGANGAVGARYYSIHRGYGEQPDPIPMTQTGVGQ